MKRLLSWFAPGLILIFGAAYFLAPRFSLGVNQVCEMLLTGNARGLMMVFHSAGNGGIIIAISIGCLAFLVPFIKPEYLLQANIEYFGLNSGILLTVLGALLALTLLLLVGHSLWALMPTGLRNRLSKAYRYRHFLPAGFAVWMLIRII